MPAKNRGPADSCDVKLYLNQHRESVQESIPQRESESRK